MRIKTSILSVLGAMFLLASCSDDDNTSSTPVATTNLSIKAKASLNSTSGRLAKANDNVEVNSFLINISNIEFEYATSGKPVMGVAKSDDDINLSFEELPIEIQNYLTTNYPNDAFCKAELEDDNDDPYMYEVELNSGLEIYFRADFSVYATEQDDEPCNGSNYDDDDDNDWGDDDEVNLVGPFELDLSNDAVTVVDIDIPLGTYEEVEFEMNRSSNSASPLYQKSILVTGTIDGTNFEFYHTFDEDFEVDYEDVGQNLLIDNTNNASIVFNFDLNAVFNSVDLSNAADGNNNGIIEINPVDNDGNQALANQLKNAIVLYAELQDD